MDEIHDNGYIYIDLNENSVVSNFSLKNNKENSNNMRLINFRFTKQYKNFQSDHTLNQIPQKRRGTRYYASANLLAEGNFSPKDDIISVIYLLMDMGIGELPWYEFCREKSSSNREEINKQKLEFDVKTFCGTNFKFLYNIFGLINDNKPPKKKLRYYINTIIIL